MARYHSLATEEMDAEGSEDEEETHVDHEYDMGAYASAPPTNGTYYSQATSAEHIWLPQQGQVQSFHH